MSIKDDLTRLGHDIASDISNTYQRVHMQHTGWLLPFAQGHDPAASKEGSEPEKNELDPTPKPERDQGIDFDR